MARRIAHFNDPRLEAQIEEIIRSLGKFQIGGQTKDRPKNPKSFQQYFDTDLNKPVWWVGTKWVDANGNEV